LGWQTFLNFLRVFSQRLDDLSQCEQGFVDFNCFFEHRAVRMSVALPFASCKVDKLQSADELI
jgi:hypothetical protein